MNKKVKDIIVDSNMSREEIVAENPERIAPEGILDIIEILTVNYFSFDGQIHSGQIAMNKSVISDVKNFFELAFEIKFPIEKVVPISNKKYMWSDEVSCDDNNSSGYNYRKILGTENISKHGLGLAFDINPAQNIYVKYNEKLEEIFRSPKGAIYDEEILGTLTPGHPLVKCMKDQGWIWGGDWTPESGRVDYQHFEKAII